ncbi:uncharacterized protein LOC126883607 [Diabrotica virgifera virgifera]|uniref:Uncharacterized protein n=1 Tax=Diabrotica virgifera virgifera TaxID=50390 RepID=A0ABM5K4U7_DIAVI|nr:uncharacterized protein LOC126883607 [Diabrotica virgifera virgifera]
MYSGILLWFKYENGYRLLPFADVHMISENDLHPVGGMDLQEPPNKQLQALLGDECETPILFAPSLHNDIASRWNVILRKGLDLDKRKEVIAKYAPPENCKNVLPPNLNLHVKGALTDSNERRDARLSSLQSQVGAGIAAIGKVLSSLYEKGEERDKENIQALSDAGRILADVHYQETISRRDLVLLNINKDLRDTLSESPPDEWLFGGNLEEAIKAKKTIDISSQQLRSKKGVRKPLIKNQSLNSARPLRLSNRGAYRSGPPQPRQAPRPRTQFRKKPDHWQMRKDRRH